MERRFISLDDWHLAMSSIKDLRERIIFYTIYYTGCSETEILSLRFSDVDHEKNLIRFSDRESSIPEKLSLDIKEFKGSSKSEYLLSSRQSDQMSPKRLQQIVTESSRKNFGSKISPQDIRYIHICHALLKNVPPVSIAKQVGVSYQRIAQVLEEIDDYLETRCFVYEL